jgi:hypothetical protein
MNMVPNAFGSHPWLSRRPPATAMNERTQKGRITLKTTEDDAMKYCTVFFSLLMLKFSMKFPV